MTVISAVLVIVRRNGFLPKQMKPGDTIRHRGVVVVMDTKGLTIKAGKHRVDVVQENRYANHWEQQISRHSFQNGESLNVMAHSMIGKHGKLIFRELCLRSDGIIAKDNYIGKLEGFVVCHKQTLKPIGLSDVFL